MLRSDFKSDEEWHFYNWLLEAENKGLVSDINTSPASIELSPRAAVEYQKQLKTKTKTAEHFLYHPHVYTPDFVFRVTDDSLVEYFIASKNLGQLIIHVDVKGTGSKFHDDKQFQINRKWVWNRYGIYIQKIVPLEKKKKGERKGFFKNTWVPEICRLTPVTKQPSTTYLGFRVVSEFIVDNIVMAAKQSA